MTDLASRRGIVCGGCWLVDHNNSIVNWPEEETLTNITERAIDGGGPAHNMAIDLARLDASLPLWAIGAVGDDDSGRRLQAWCIERKIDTRQLRTLAGVGTSHTDVMTVRATGRRTFFHYQGANALLSPDDFDFMALPARILHLGAPGIHNRMDQPWQADANGWVTVLRNARQAGLWTNLEMISATPDALRAMVTPCLPYLDSLIINDYEAGALTGIDVVKHGSTSVAAARQAADALRAQADLALVVIHFPGGCVAASRKGEQLALPSLNVPLAAIAGANGAGDAFAAGVLYGVHENWPLDSSLRLGLCSAAAALRSVSTTAAVASVAENLALAEQWGWRAPI